MSLETSHNQKRQINCPGCNETKPHHAKGYCQSCYKKHVFRKRLITCKNCGRERPHKAFGLCDGCHTRLFHYDKVKAYNAKKDHGIELEEYKKLTEKCIVCGFDKIVELHHLDQNKKNKNKHNLVGLCPNCHKMIHSNVYWEEIRERLNEKGYQVADILPSKGRK